jgi:hypothetical protein
MRARLFARDGIQGDLVEGAMAAMRALMPNGDPPKQERAPKRLGVLTGMLIGGTVVGEEVVGRRSANGSRIYVVPCAGCAAPQWRDSGRLGVILRRGGNVECPACIAERCRGAKIARARTITDRVLAGGPVWTWAEVNFLCEAVLAALVSEFGETVDPDDSMPVPLETANGWPWSHADKTSGAWRSLEREHVERLREKERERLLTKALIEDGKEAVALLSAISEGDARAMFDVLGEIQ